MTDIWQNILEQQNSISMDSSSSISAAYVPLPQLGVLTISGEDAQSFLQNLLTNDVNALDNNQSQLSGFCNAKGRLFSVFTLIRRQDYYQMVLPRSMCSLLHQRLAMYVLRSKVTVTDDTEHFALFSIPNSDLNPIESLMLSADKYQLLLNNGQYLCIIPKAEIETVINTIDSLGWQIIPEASWNLASISAGLPSIVLETKEKFTPQQVNLDLVDGVSFKKGCYPGQEVVARLHYLGSPSRRMFIAHIDSGELPKAGEEVLNGSGNVAGHIVCAEQNTDKIDLLISIKLSELNSPLSVGQANPVNILNRNLPE
jgi:hypothetical protein